MPRWPEIHPHRARRERSDWREKHPEGRPHPTRAAPDRKPIQRRSGRRGSAGRGPGWNGRTVRQETGDLNLPMSSVKRLVLYTRLDSRIMDSRKYLDCTV